jgi:hypothetical protein
VNISIYSGDTIPTVLYEMNGETVYLTSHQKITISDLRVESGEIVIIKLGTIFKLKVQQFLFGNLKINIRLSRKEFFNVTTGLFGTFTDSIIDDFQLPNGTYYTLPNVDMPSKLLYTNWAIHWQVPHAYPSLFKYNAAIDENWMNHTCPHFLPAFESDDLSKFVSDSFFESIALYCSTSVDSKLYYQCLLEQVLMSKFIANVTQLRESIVDLNAVFNQQKQLHNEVPVFPAGSGSKLYHLYQWHQLNISLRAIDPEGSPIQYNVHSIPPGSLFNASSGYLSWYATSFGYYVVNMSASDGVNTIFRTFGINVTVPWTPNPSQVPTAEPSAKPSPITSRFPTTITPSFEPTYSL